MSLILIADDNPTNRQLLGWQLDTLGFASTSVGSGRGALQACADASYALVCMDLNLGDMDGYAVARVLRESETHVRTPIVAITAHAGLSQYDQCMAAGMNDFFTKPMALGPLAMMLVRWGLHYRDADNDADSDADNDADNDADSDAQSERPGECARLPLIASNAADWLRALEKKAMSAGLAATMVRDFIERSTARMRRLRTAARNDDAVKVNIERFALERFASGIGADRLSHAMRERAPCPGGPQSKPPPAGEHDALQPIVDATCAAFEQLIDQL